jgi:hypothetical protein
MNDKFRKCNKCRRMCKVTRKLNDRLTVPMWVFRDWWMVLREYRWLSINLRCSNKCNRLCKGLVYRSLVNCELSLAKLLDWKMIECGILYHRRNWRWQINNFKCSNRMLVCSKPCSNQLLTLTSQLLIRKILVAVVKPSNLHVAI